MKRFSSYEIALSGIACAFCTILLVLGVHYTPLLFTGYLLGGVALMLPLSEKKYGGCFLAYVGACLLTLLLSGGKWWDVLPFIFFFGLHPLVNALQEGFRVPRWIAIPVKAVWFDVAMYFVWRFIFGMNTAIAWVDKWIFPILLIGGSLFFLFYDFAVTNAQRTVNSFLNKTIRPRK